MMDNVKKLDKTNHNNICSNCKANALITDVDTGKRTCKKCGVEKTEKIYGMQDASTTGSSKDVGGTKISTTGKDASGNSLTGEAKKIAKRITRHNTRDKSNRDKTESIASLEISRLCDVIKIHDVVKDRGVKIFTKCRKHQITVRDMKCFSASCLYAACREAGVIRIMKDFTKNTVCKRSKLRADYTKIIEILEIKTKIMLPKEYISRIGTNTDPVISVIIQRKAIKLLEKLDGMEGKDPMGIAAAALCYECRLKNTKHTLKNIASTADLNPGTVRSRMKEIKKMINKIQK